MASKYKVWVDYANVSDNTLEFDSQQQTGFKGGTAASAKRVNTILRQNSLVVSALMGIVDGGGTTDYSSPIANVQALMQSYFNGFVKSTRKVAGKTLTEDVNLGTLTLKMNGVQQGQVYDGTTNREIDFTDVAKKSEVDGKKVYVHQIMIRGQGLYSYYAYITIYSKTISTAVIDLTTFKALLQSSLTKGFKLTGYSDAEIACTGVICNSTFDNSVNKYNMKWVGTIVGVKKTNGKLLYVSYDDNAIVTSQFGGGYTAYINKQEIDWSASIQTMIYDDVTTISLGDL